MALAFDVKHLTLEQKKAILSKVSQNSLINQEHMDALHVVLDDDIFFLLFLLSGEEIRFPSRRDLQAIYRGVVTPEETNNGTEG